MKLAFLIADGMGDYPIEELGGKTPLEYAHTPNMGLLAKYGELGLCQTIPKQMEPGSDIANMALLGFDPVKYHTGRGPIEAAALKVEADEDDVIFRMNLVTITEFSDKGIMLDYSGGHISKEEGMEIVKKLKSELEDENWRFVPGFQYRHLLIRKHGLNTSYANMCINPPHDILNKSIKDDFEQYSREGELFELINRAIEIIKNNFPDSKANCIWPWGQGKRLLLPDFYKTFGLRGGVISAVDLIKGLGYASNMDVIEVEGATGLLDTNYTGKADKAISFLEEKDFVFVHLEGPDECGHGGDIQGKIKAIERFDLYIVGPITKFLEQEKGASLICCDHLTPISKRTHVKDPVPILLNNFKNPGANQVDGFSEKTARKSNLFFEKGDDIIRWILREFKV